MASIGVQPNVLLQRRDDPREPEQIRHLESVSDGARERRRPARILLQVRQCVSLQEADEHLGDDAATDIAVEIEKKVDGVRKLVRKMVRDGEHSSAWKDDCPKSASKVA